MLRKEHVLAGPDRKDAADYIQFLQEEVVAMWHMAHTGKPLHEHLGMTEEEYADWASPMEEDYG